MANLLIGDVHGCYNELMKVLEKANFSSDDTIWLTGDLVARGPNSLEVLRFVKKHNMQVRLSLGNHDIHLLAVHAGISKPHKNDCTDTIFSAPDCDELINWLRVQPLMQIDEENKIIMAHAGISPQWDLQTAKNCARELNLMLSSNIYTLFLESMYGYYPDLWQEDLKGTSRLRYIVNAFTRMRYCYKEDGRLDFSCKKSPEDAPNRLKPWFSLHSKIPSEYSIVFGHWASLNGQCDVDNIYALDTGCCWNGKLTCLRWEDKMYFKKVNKTKK